ncbi:hypothetical protein [Planctomicrobium piriforme]|nr:hypothetical protein [Planctomicrobium piriforme]
MAWFKSKSKPLPGTRRYVDMWAFMGAHPTNLDLFQRLKSGDDQQFGVNMDVCGTVSQLDDASGKWTQSHLIGIRTDAWNPKPQQQQKKLEAIQLERQETLRRLIKQSGSLSSAQTAKLHKQMLFDPVMKLRPGDLETRRLVLKLFRENSERIRWVGSIEEIVTTELARSTGAGKPLLSLTASLEGHKYLAEMQENQLRYRIPSIYTFCYFHEKRARMWYVTIRRKWISIGADFIVEAEGRKIGDIDGALFGFGYNAHVAVYDPDLSKDTQFLDLLTMFTASVSYHGAVRRAIRNRLRGSRTGIAGDQIIEDEEFRLLKNPRAA